jgi:protocatechuate 3,4-dioxygenase beta subunit
MHKLIQTLLLFIAVTSCQSQANKKELIQIVGGPCEGCEAIFEYGNKTLAPTDTLPDFEQNTPQLKLTGVVFEKDGKTPAENVVLYIYHTDRNGVYVKQGNEEGWAKRHGYIRGWIQTDQAGKYTFYTFRPAAYPNRMEPEHIHITVKEPTKSAYYIDAIVFDDDPLLSEQKRNALNNRGGSAIVHPVSVDGMLTIRRDIILGLNIPEYQ